MSPSIIDLMKGIVYILKSSRCDTFYVGSTNDFDRRLEQHQSGKSKYTSHILPVNVVFKQEFSSLRLARKIEYWIKRQKDKDFLIRIINEGKITKKF